MTMKIQVALVTKVHVPK